MHKVIDLKTSKKISILMFVACVCVVFYHGVNLEDNSVYELSNNIIGNISKVLVNIWYPLCQSFAMPFFLISSGVLFYKKIDKTSDTKNEIKKRIKSILIPYLLWNAIWTIFAVIISKNQFIVSKVNGMAIFNGTFLDITKGIFLYKFNGVMWYLLYIFIYTLLSPIIYNILKRKYIGITFISLIFIISVLEKTILNSYNIFWPFLFYLIGAYIMIQRYDLINRHYNKKNSIIGLGIFAIIMIFTTNWRPTDNMVEGALYLVSRIGGGISLWVGIDYFVNDKRKISDIINYYFFIYLFHFIPALCVSKSLKILLPHNWISLLINKYVGGLSVILLSCAVGYIMKKYMPKVYAILTGSRKERN